MANLKISRSQESRLPVPVYAPQHFIKSTGEYLPVLSLSFSLDQEEKSRDRLSKSAGDFPECVDVVKKLTPQKEVDPPANEVAEESRSRFANLTSTVNRVDLFQRLPFHQADRNLCLVGSSWVNVDKNLYPSNFWACDATRVLLSEPISESAETAKFEPYYNGNYVSVSGASAAEQLRLIVCQGTKTGESVEQDFWRMVFHNRVPAILMLTRLAESGKVKCSRYFPNPGESKTWGPSSSVSRDGVCVRSLKWVDEGYAEISTFEVSVGDHSPIQVEHFFYKSWRDFDVPDHSQFSYFLARFLEVWLNKETPRPAVVHCSAGLGRSGCAALIIKILENPETDPIELLRELREQRHGLVQTYEQFQFACSFRSSA